MGGGSLLGKISNLRSILVAVVLAGVISLLTVLTFFSLSPSAHATTPANGSASSTADVVLNLTSAISIRTLDSTASSEIESLNLELTPTPSGRFTKDTTVVDVSTSNPSGYKLYMQSDYTDPSTSTPSTPVYTTDMLHSNPSVSDKVANLGSTNVTEVAFSAANSSYRNSWGYSLNGLSVTGSSSPTITPNTNPASIIYNPVPAHANAVTINGGTTSATEHSYTPVTIGANVDTNIVSGT
ncbi:hypothetical protein IJ098_02820, partial [Candidatus Saccharibacteria bacterium]|nr:hypothetical protein [Candidatus Saccharibacteria bacterium]